MIRTLVNIINVINNKDGSSNQISVYQEQEVKLNQAGFKSLVNTELTYFNMQRERVSPQLKGFQRISAGPTTHYSIKALF